MRTWRERSWQWWRVLPMPREYRLSKPCCNQDVLRWYRLTDNCCAFWNRRGVLPVWKSRLRRRHALWNLSILWWHLEAPMKDYPGHRTLKFCTIDRRFGALVDNTVEESRTIQMLHLLILPTAVLYYTTFVFFCGWRAPNLFSMEGAVIAFTNIIPYPISPVNSVITLSYP